MDWHTQSLITLNYLFLSAFQHWLCYLCEYKPLLQLSNPACLWKQVRSTNWQQHVSIIQLQLGPAAAWLGSAHLMLWQE